MQIISCVGVFRVCECLSKNGISGALFAEVAVLFVTFVFVFLFRTVELETPAEDNGGD